MPIDLITPRGEQLLADGSTPWQVYPRPQLKRNSYVNLNGSWEFTVSPDGQLPQVYDRTILVPFCPESQLSGLKFHPKDGDFLFYRRSFSTPELPAGGHLLLHIDGADQVAEVYVNQKRIGSHAGGYEAFTLDITDAVTICVTRPSPTASRPSSGAACGTPPCPASGKVSGWRLCRSGTSDG